jgi:predicted GIY-YIG superfamily endonuclease
MHIYILELQDGNWYIGKTIDPEVRIATHQFGTGSAWTRMYPPVRVAELIPDCIDDCI